MDDERNKKLAAGRDRLAKFQKKKKKKKKDPKPESSKPNRDSTLDSTPSFIEENTNAGDSLDEFSAGSSDLLGSNSDILSSFSEIDQRSIGTDDLCQDSDTSQLDAEVARVELAESRSRIHQLEESLLGKQTALDLLQNELTQMRATVNNNTDNEGTTTSENINKNQEPSGNVSGQEAELRAALEQYNIKIQEFQQALLQRDQVIQQLTVNMQTVVQSRDAVQAEATAQTNQLSQYIQTLQDQLKETGEALRNQSGEQMSSLADELSMAQNQVTALQQNVADKDATMQQLAERYAQKAQELIELSEDREELKRKNMGEISALQQKLRETTGEDSPMTKDQTLMNLQAELDESYGSQIVMMKQQLEEKRRQEVDLWKQRYDEMERIAAASSDSNLMRTELENQLKEANEKLKAKDEAIMTARGNVDNLNQKLSNVSATYQKQLDDLKASHANEIEFVAEQAQKRTGEHIDELKKELESTQDELNTSLTDLEEEKKKVGEAVEELAENALNSSSLRGNLTKEIGILAAEIQRKDEEIQELNQLNEVVAELKAKNEKLQEELEQQRERVENGPTTDQEASSGADVDKLQILKQSLDEGNQKILDEIMKEKDETNEQEKENVKSELENQHREELNSLKATAEAVYSSQLDEQLARSEHEKSQALVEQLEELHQRQEGEMEQMRKDYEEAVMEKEEQYQSMIKDTNDLTNVSSEELIGRLQEQLNDEHQQVIQDLTQQWDQATLEYLEVLRSKMEDKHLEELEIERGSVKQNIEGDIEHLKKQWEEDHQLDTEALINERERVVAQAEEMKTKLESVHMEELAKVRAAMQADYDQLAKAREDLDKTRSQTEQSLKQELEGLRDAFEDLQQKYVDEKESVAAKFGGDDADAAGLIRQLQQEVDELQKELTNQRSKLQLEHSEELGKLRSYFEQELADTEEKWSKEMENVKAGNTSLGSSLEEPELKAAKMPDFSHSLMTLTHISDTDSSPPRSPVKNKDMEAEFRQHLRGDMEKDYQKGLENLRNELENDHKAETARIKLDYEIKHEQDLEREKEAMRRKHEHEKQIEEMNHLEALDNLRKELDDHHAKEVARLRMEHMGEVAKQLEEERENAKHDYDKRLSEEVEEMKAEIEEKYKTELMEKINEEKDRQSEMAERHANELERLHKEFAKEKATVESNLKDSVSSEVAQVLADTSISFAEESETQREELFKKNDLIAILKHELAETEARTQKLSEVIDSRNAEEAQNQTQTFQEKYSGEIVKLQKQLEEEQAKFQKLQEDVQSGEAPEVQTMRENLVQQYDGQLEMIKTTMNEELETLTRMTQLQSAKDLEEMQTKFVSEHEQMIERFAEDQERAMEEVRVQHEMDVENTKKQLVWQHGEDKNKELEALEERLQEAKEQEIADLNTTHQKELEEMSKRQEKELNSLKSEYDERWKQEKAKMDKELGEELKRFDDADAILQQLRENHEQEKVRLKDELTTIHMEKFKEVTDQLELEHQKQLEEMREATKREVEKEAGEKLKILEAGLEAEKSSKGEMQKGHLEEIEQMKETFDEQLKRVRSDLDGELATAKSELEEAHQQEVADIQAQLEDERKSQVEELNDQLKEVTDLMKLEHQRKMEQVLEEHQKQVDDLDREKDKLEDELRLELQKIQEEKDRMMQENLASSDGEKGAFDAILRERDEKWQKELQKNEDQHQQVLQKLLDEINQVQEEKAALVKRGLEQDTVLARRERENEETNNLISLLRSDLDRIGNERENLQQTNNHLLQVLSQAVKSVIATEDTINKKLSHVEGRRKSSPSEEAQEGHRGVQEGAVGGGDVNDVGPNTSILSNMSDEGLELSQQLAESMFAGPDLDSDGEELITNANNRLQASIDSLLERMTGLSGIEEPIQASRSELQQTSPTDEADSRVRAETERLEERLEEESTERQRLTAELDRTQGLLQGMHAQTDELEQSLQASEQKQLQVIMDLETARNAKIAAEAECQKLRQQQNQLIEKLDGKERDLANEVAHLNQENTSLKKEIDDLLQQTKKDRESYKNQIELVESSVEEQLAKLEKEIEDKNLEVEDLQDQRLAADKLLKANKQFLQQQSAEREQERDEFQREIRRLEELSGKDKPNNFEEEDIRRELQDTKEDLKAVKEDCEALSNQNQELETEVILKDETVHELTQQIKELERTLEQNKEIVEPLRAEKGSLEKEVVELRKLEEELTHEKDALHKQCSDQLLQISALQSKLDAHKHGLDETRQMSAFEEDEDEGKSLASVTLMQQLEQEREALERKDMEIKALEEQLDQFRDGFVSKEDEISQLNLQLDIANRATRPEEKPAESVLVAENKDLKDRLASLQEKLANLPSSSSLDGLAEGLIEEKNQQIDELTGQVLEAQRELEEVKDQLEDVKENEDEALKEDLEKNLEEKDQEIASLRDQIDKWKDQVEQITDRQDDQQHREESMQGSSETTMHLEEELKRLRALLAIREREIAQLEAQLMSLQGSPGRDKNIQEETVDRLQKEMEDKDLQLMQLKIQVDQAEETVFQAQQQLSQVSDLPRQNQQLLFGMEEVQERHTKEIQDLKAKHKELSARREAEHKNEIERMMAAQEEDWKKIQQLEKDYEGKLTHIGKLSPGKTLQQKLDEIKKELTKQHQEHVADIQRTMAKEADERIEQLRAQMTQESLLMQQRHQHELEEAILRTNRDLMAAHAEEVAKIRDDHRQEVDRILATSPANMSQFSDINQLMQSELELAQLRGRPGGIGQELPSQADSGVSSGDATTEGLSDKLKTILSRIKGEGLSLLSLSELRYLHDQTMPRTPLQRGLDVGSLQEAWENEKRALLDAIQSLKDLVTQLSGSQRDLNQDDADWRGELLLTIQQVFQCEREALRAELSTNVAMSGDQNITDVQLLQRRIREQENFHKSAVEQIYGADRSSILGESRDLFSQNNALQEELQRSRQRLTQQLKALEEQSNKRERQLKRQLETMEHKYRQERILVEDLRTSLVLEKEKGEQLSEALQKVKGHEEELQEELSDLLTKIDKQIGDREAVESRLADVTILADTALAAFEAERSHNRSLNVTLSEEKKASRSLNDAYETENRRVQHARNREQQIIKELHRELQQEKNKLVDAEKTAEKEALRSNALSRELEAIRSETVSEVQHEKAKFTELKTAIDVERTRCQELKTALQKEQVLNAQLQATMEQERQKNADTSLQEKTLIAELQAKLDTSQAEVIDIQGQIKQLENSIRRKEGVLETERAQHKEVVSRERAASRQMKSSLDAVENKLEEVERQLISEQEKAARLKADKERLHQSLESQAETDKDKVGQRERERENEKRKQLERDREREMERQKQHDLELEHQLDQQKIRSLEEQVEDWKNHAQQTLEELQRLQDKQKYENEEDVEMQRELEMELQKSLERHSPAGKEAGPSGQRSRYHLLKEQLEAIRQRLQLIAVKEHEGLGLLRRMNQTVADSSSSTAQEIHTLERNLQEATAELKQIHGALVLQVETSTGVPASKARLNTRLLNQNAELSNYISKLSDEKSEMRRQLSQLEEQLWTLKQRQLHQTSSSPRGTRRDLDSLFAEEISSWERERLSTQNALRQAEREIIRLKLELEQNAANRESDVELLLSNGDIPEHQQQKFQRLYGKYLRAESFRKSLIYQKKYLLLLLGGFQDTEEASLALIAKMGGYPNPANMEQTNRRSKAFTKFRSAVRVCIAISRLKFLKKKWQRACGTSNHSTPQSLPTHHSVPSYPPSLPPVRHSSTPGTTTLAPPLYRSPGRINSRLGGTSMGSPPVRDRVVSGSSNGVLNGASNYISPQSYRSSSHSRARERLSMSPQDPMEDPEVSLSKYIRKLENLQERIGSGSRRGDQNGKRRQPPSQQR